MLKRCLNLAYMLRMKNYKLALEILYKEVFLSHYAYTRQGNRSCDKCTDLITPI